MWKKEKSHKLINKVGMMMGDKELKRDRGERKQKAIKKRNKVKD